MNKLDDILRPLDMLDKMGLREERKGEIKALMLELIGEDSDDNFAEEDLNTGHYHAVIAVNRTKNELRKKVKSL